MNKTEITQSIARQRAYFAAHEGGILLTQIGGLSKTGAHWRTLLDGGNRYNGRYHWIVGAAHGGGWDVKAGAMAAAINGICRQELRVINGDVSWANRSQWREILSRAGWRMMDWGEDAGLALIPSEDVCAKIKGEIKNN